MKKITLVTVLFFIGLFTMKAQTTSCIDQNAYVDSKNVAGIGFYTLIYGFEEQASQTYYYSGPGKISQVHVHGNYPSVGGVALRVSIYYVDVNGRPTSLISSADATFWQSDNVNGYISVTMPNGGTTVSNKFAIGVAIVNAEPWGTSFQLKYTGNGEGLGADLASLAGTSTGGNWASAMTTFSRDGDFYLVPRMTNFNTANFNASTNCATTSTSISFSNLSSVTKDSMFNIIGLTNYIGTNYFYTWNFGDGTPVSHLENPTHTFATNGSYDVVLTTTIEGWGGICTSTKTMKISVGLTVSTSSIINVACNGGSTGSITATSSGGASPFFYSLNNSSFQSSPTFSNLSAGNYSVYTKDAVGCLNNFPFIITQPAPITFTTASSTNSSCGNSNGSILVATNGGSGAIQYQLNSGTFQSSGTFSGLASGSYTITAKDVNNCTSSVSILVNDLGSAALSVLSVTNVSCYGGNDGSITLSGSGGTGTLMYSINGGLSYQVSGSFTGLTAGNYSVLVKDASQCTQGSLVIISQPNPIQFTASTVETTCNGGSDGQINITQAIGGIGTLIYSINGVSYQSSPNFSGLTAGNYIVYVKGSASCVAQAAVFINEPMPIATNFALNAAGCNGSSNGSIIVSASGGTQPYVYSINGNSEQPSNEFYDLTAGLYVVMVKDARNCSFNTSVTITQPSTITSTITPTNSTCGNSNGGLLAVASGGSGSGYLYSLDGIAFNSSGSFTSMPSGNYFVTSKDGTGCSVTKSTSIMDSDGPAITSSSSTNVACYGGYDGTITVNSVTGGTGVLNYSINGYLWQTGTFFTGLSASTYTLYVKDANGCIGTVQHTLTQPNAFAISNNLVNVSCFNGTNGSASIFAAGGAGTLAYSINNGVTFQSSNTFNNLAAGAYTVIVRDVASCTASYNFTITQPLDIITYIGVLNVTCFGSSNGSATVYAFGGVGQLLYSIDGSPYQASNIFNGLSGGLHIVYVKDGNNCVKSQSIIVFEPANLSISANTSNVSCSGGNNGSINLTVQGGNGSNTYAWSNGATSEDLFGLSNGFYSVTITDAFGCTTIGSYTITQPSAPIVVNSVVTGTNGTSGAIDATITGGTTPYIYSWSNGATTEDISNLAPGIYTLTVFDASGCISTNQFIVQNIAGLVEVSVSEGELIVYPNPTSDFTTIETNGFTIEKISVLNIL